MLRGLPVGFQRKVFIVSLIGDGVALRSGVHAKSRSDNHEALVKGQPFFALIQNSQDIGDSTANAGRFLRTEDGSSPLPLTTRAEPRMEIYEDHLTNVPRLIRCGYV